MPKFEKRNIPNYLTILRLILVPIIFELSTISALIIKGIIPFWILAILTLKELIMISVAFVLYKRNVVTVHSMWYR